MSSIDPYVMLGVSKKATQEEIKSAYRKKALKYHPDRNPDDPQAEELFKSVSTAYSMIGNEDARAEYDRSQARQRARKPSEDRGFNDIFRNVNWPRHEDESTWEDLFGSFRSTRQKPFAIRARIDIRLEDLVRGTRKTFVMDGNSVDFSIPPGARHGTSIVVQMRNNQELHATVSVADHPVFRVVGDDLHCVIAVPVSVAITGGEVSAQTLESDVKLKISKFTGSHKKLRVRNYGLPRADGSRGSIIYELKLAFDSMTLEEMSRLESYLS